MTRPGTRNALCRDGLNGTVGLWPLSERENEHLWNHWELASGA
jgi:hypothetical protein